MPLAKLREYLHDHSVKYTVIEHSPAYTAQEIAAAAHVPGRELAKTVMVKIDDQLAMVVLPASGRVHLGHLKSAMGAQAVQLADENEFGALFPDAELGAMPPFGNLYGIPVLVIDSLTEDEEIVFNAGTHTELMRLRYRDFEQLVHPRVIAA